MWHLPHRLGRQVDSHGVCSGATVLDASAGAWFELTIPNPLDLFALSLIPQRPTHSESVTKP